MVAEFILLFVVLPVLFAFVKVPGGPIPVLLVLAGFPSQAGERHLSLQAHPHH